MFSKTQCRATVGDVAQGDAETFHVAVTLDSLQRIFHSVIGSTICMHVGPQSFSSICRNAGTRRLCLSFPFFVL